MGIVNGKKMQNIFLKDTQYDSSNMFRRLFSTLTHVDASGKAAMVDTTHKVYSYRKAYASAQVILGKDVFQAVQTNTVQKGDVLTVSKLAGIMGVKKCSELIPLCHPINVTHADVQLTLQEPDRLHIVCSATVTHSTGVEMEALTGATVAALTVYDMCKAMSKDIQITNVQLQGKLGGKSGPYERR